MRIINCLVIAISLLTINASFAETKNNLIKQLRFELKNYSSDNSLLSTKKLNNTLTQILKKPELIEQICAAQPLPKERKYCNTSVFSFSKEATGLHNSLEVLMPIIKECHDDTSCINNKAGNLFSMIDADIAQLTLYLKYTG